LKFSIKRLGAAGHACLNQRQTRHLLFDAEKVNRDKIALQDQTTPPTTAPAWISF
jgi:hypothetical protein